METHFQYIPIESQIQKYQDRYYKSISKCHVEGNSNIFIEFMLEMIDEILTEIISQTKSDIRQMNDYVKKLLDVMEFDVSYNTAELLDKLNLKSRETFRKIILILHSKWIWFRWLFPINRQVAISGI